MTRTKQKEPGPTISQSHSAKLCREWCKVLWCMRRRSIRILGLGVGYVIGPELSAKKDPLSHCMKSLHCEEGEKGCEGSLLQSALREEAIATFRLRMGSNDATIYEKVFWRLSLGSGTMELSYIISYHIIS